jgi:Tfp pilus assembly protein PilF
VGERRVLRPDESSSKGAVAEAAASLLGKRLDAAGCEAARARLKADGWALEAMVDVGFCDAAAGDLDKADGVFMRLLAYTPDNYEALVGRALIARAQGKKDIARGFFQAALNALPPIAESERIEAAMRGV